MAHIEEPTKRFIVQQLACFYSPSEVAEMVKLEYGIELPRQQVEFYDATKPQGKERLSTELKELFHQTREAVLAAEREIPCANRAYRLLKLQRLIDHPQVSKNLALVKDLLAQAAKEMGGDYDGRTEARRAAIAGVAAGHAAGQAITGVVTDENGQIHPGIMTALLAQLNDALEQAEAEVIESQFVNNAEGKANDTD